MLEWLFFDIGSTLLDETDAIRARAETSVEALRGTPQECSFDTFEVGIAKPDLRIFQTALSQANCNSENAVMIGDRLDNEIYPAKKLGMKTIWVRQGWGGMSEPASEEYQPNYTASSLTEIVPALDKLTSNRDQIIL
jgi:FMN phosphatase YigB (HAD superfamily)